MLDTVTNVTVEHSMGSIHSELLFAVTEGLLTLDSQAVSSSVSAHLYHVRMTKLGHVVPHVFDEELLFEPPGMHTTGEARAVPTPPPPTFRPSILA